MTALPIMACPHRVLRGLGHFLLALAIVWGVPLACAPSPTPAETAHVTVNRDPGPPPPPLPQASAQQAEPSEEAPKRESAFLWTVRSDSATVHLFGSVHVGTPSMYPLDARVYERFDAADTLVLEVDITPEKSEAATLLMAKAALLPPGETLWQKLDPDTTLKLRQRLDAVGLPQKQLQRLKPWFVSLLLLMQQLEAAGFTPELGLEHHFKARSQEKHDIIELETIESQVALLASMSSEASAQDLTRALETDSASELGAIAEEWKVGRTGLLLKSLTEMKAEYPEAYEQLFAARNRTMASKVKELLRSSRTVFFVVGAGHLVGPDGVLALLRRDGLSPNQL